MTQENESHNDEIDQLASEVEQILYDMYSVSEFAPDDTIMNLYAMIAPSDWVIECRLGASRTQRANVMAYVDGTKTKQELIDNLTLGKVTPIVMSQIFDLADKVKGDTK